MSGHRPVSSSSLLHPSFAQQVGRVTLIVLALLFLLVFLVLPVAAVFTQALSQGWKMYRDSISQADVLSALRLTGLVAGIAVPLNLAFGFAASWAITDVYKRQG